MAPALATGGHQHPAVPDQSRAHRDRDAEPVACLDVRMKTLLLVLLGSVAVSGPGAAELRDPMRPPGLAQGGPQRSSVAPTRVTAVFISPTRRAAVVDGKLVHAGESAGLCFVEEVLDRGVRCRFSKSVRVVQLPTQDYAIRKTTATAVVANGAP